jgi:hypothetical protein
VEKTCLATELLDNSSTDYPLLDGAPGVCTLYGCVAQNWVLFYSLIYRHLKEMFPVIYTRQSDFSFHRV